MVYRELPFSRVFTWAPQYVCVLISPYCKDTSHIGSGSIPATSFKLRWLFKDFPKHSHILSYWRLRHQHTSYGGWAGDTIHPVTEISSTDFHEDTELEETNHPSLPSTIFVLAQKALCSGTPQSPVNQGDWSGHLKANKIGWNKIRSADLRLLPVTCLYGGDFRLLEGSISGYQSYS